VGAAEEVVHDYADAPDVDLFVVHVAAPDLRGHVDGGAAVGAEHFAREDLADAEVCQLE